MQVFIGRNQTKQPMRKLTSTCKYFFSLIILLVPFSSQAGFPDPLVNTATVTVPPGVTDPVPGNNSATDSNTLAKAVLTLVKDVTNDDGGTAVDTDFILTATGPQTISGNEGDAAVTNASVNVGTYVLSEAAIAGYTWTTLACTNATAGGTDVSGVTQAAPNLTLAVNDNVTCTYTNDDNEAPTITKVFSPDNIAVNGTSTLTITITNPNAFALTNAAMTDTYPTEITNTTPANASTDCGGILTAVDGGGNVTLSGGTIPASGSCSITVDVTSATQGTHTNTTGVVSTDEAADSATATDDLTAAIPSLAIAKTLDSHADEDGSGDVSLNDTLTYSVTVTNDGTTTLNNVVVSDALLTPNSNTCATLAASATCVLTGTHVVTQAEVDAGSVDNTGSVTSTEVPGPTTVTLSTPVAQNHSLAIAKTLDSHADEDGSGDVSLNDTIVDLG